MTMNIRPLGDHVVIQLIEESDTTAAGIVLPASAQDKPERGTVLAVGPGKQTDAGTRLAMEVKEGDTVLFKKYAPDTFTIDGQEIHVVAASDIIAIVA